MPLILISASDKLGVIYETGQGVKQNDQKAFELISKTAKQGLDRAQVVLGQMYPNGEGVKQDKEKTLFWLRKAAEQNNELAQEF